MANFSFLINKDTNDEQMDLRGRILKQVQERVPTPKSMYIPSKTVTELLKFNTFLEKVESHLRSLDQETFTNINDISKNIQSILLGLQYPENLKKDILETYKSINSIEGIENMNENAKSFISVGKDETPVNIFFDVGEEWPYKYGIINHVKGIENLLEGIKELLTIYFSVPSLIYRTKKQTLTKIPSIIIQEDIIPERSGFMSSINIGTGNKNEIISEGVFGYPLSILNGDMNPDRYIVDKVTGNLKEKQINTKEYQYNYDNMAQKIIKNPTPDNERVLDITDLVAVYKLMDSVKSLIGEDIIVGFSISRDRVFVTDVHIIKKEFDAGVSLDDIHNSEGTNNIASQAENTIVICSGTELEGQITKDKPPLSLINDLSLNNPTVLLSKALFSRNGSFFSNLSFISRELKIPTFIVHDDSLNNQYVRINKDGIITKTQPELPNNYEEEPLKDFHGEKTALKIIFKTEDVIDAENKADLILLDLTNKQESSSLFNHEEKNKNKILEETSERNLKKEILFRLSDNDSDFQDDVSIMSSSFIKGFENIIPLIGGYTNHEMIKKMLSYIHSKGFDVINKGFGVYITLPMQLFMPKEVIKSGARLAVIDLDLVLKYMYGNKENGYDYNSGIRTFLEKTIKSMRKEGLDVYASTSKVSSSEMIDLLVFSNITGIIIKKQDYDLVSKLMAQAEKKLYLDILKFRYKYKDNF